MAMLTIGKTYVVNKDLPDQFTITVTGVAVGWVSGNIIDDPLNIRPVNLPTALLDSATPLVE